MKPMTEEIKGYKCNWCGELYKEELHAVECAYKHSRENLANSLLRDGATLETIQSRCNFRWNLKDYQKNITKDNCFVMSHWQCCDKPAYQIMKINIDGGLYLRGKGNWSGYYGNDVRVDQLSTPYPEEDLFVHKS